jgi:hypothetical protein
MYCEWEFAGLALESGPVVVCLYTGKEDGPAYEN